MESYFCEVTTFNDVGLQHYETLVTINDDEPPTINLTFDENIQVVDVVIKDF